MLEDLLLAFDGERAGALPNAPLPVDLLEAETVLNALAGVFYPTETPPGQKPRAFSEEFAQGEKDWPGVKDTYRILVEQVPAVVFLAFFDQGIGEAYVSPQIERTLGFTQAEWLQDPVRWYQQIHPDDKARWSSEAARMFLTGESLRSVYRVLARDGRVVWFHCEVKMVRHPDGRPWFIHGIGFDISELKQTEEALSQSEELLRGIFEHAPDTMVVVGGSGRIERVNAQVERMFGYAPDELLGQPVETLLPERFRARHVMHRADYVTDPHLRPMGLELVLYGRRKDGSEFPVEIMLSPVEAESHHLVIAVIRDITRRQGAEEALRDYAERMTVLSRRLIAVQEAERRGMALELHDEIGQILTGLKLKLEMADRLSSEGAHANLHANLAEAQALVNELMARTRKLSLDLRPATLDHLGLLSALLRHIRQYTSQTQVRVDFRHNGLEGRRFAAELETAAFRIVQEALTNVARHSGAAAALVRIWADQHTLAAEIEDHGKGFDPETALAADRSTGLAGMRERAMLLGGQFTVEAQPGQGARLRAEWNFDEHPQLQFHNEG
ncbi:MAG: PAS domain S-box protein [Acidobacteria bacterium]|nr:PAS domain S-box protein [Acidobacteriota bacterium]MBI3423969.1 PAS domain S-box protein [Acidobacteriota bacterium]